MGQKVIGMVVFVVAVMVFFGMIISYPIMLLWNGCLVGAIDGVREISWLQSWGLFILANLIFKVEVSTK